MADDTRTTPRAAADAEDETSGAQQEAPDAQADTADRQPELTPQEAADEAAKEAAAARLAARAAARRAAVKKRVAERAKGPKPSEVKLPANRKPTVIADDLHVVYRVFGADTPAKGKTKAKSGALGGAVSKRKGSSVREIHAVKGISFTAYEGDAIGVIGRNGSGKSTLMRAIAGLLPAHKGAVYAQGQPSFLGVNAALVRNLSGERNIELGCLALGMTREQIAAKRDDIVEFSGVGDFISMPMSTYSSGMGARLRFAIATSKSHDVLIVDEALSTGDADFRRKSEDRIRKLREEAGTVFLVSHSMKTIEDTCNRVMWIDKGVLREDGDPDTVIGAYLDEAQ